jgi:hypothetical protein
MILIGTGGRDYPPFQPFKERVFLNRLLQKYQFDAVFHGAAKGADTEIGKWAYTWGLEVREFPANWEKYGKSAGPIRNLEMLRTALDHQSGVICVAFPGGKGTHHMVSACHKCYVPVLFYLEGSSRANISKGASA